MLTLDDIIKFINLPQKKIKGQSKDQVLKLPDVFNTLHKTFKDSLYLKNNGNFYHTYLTLIDASFQISANKAEVIKNLRKKLWEKIDEKFKQYSYNRRRKFDKAKMTTELLDFDNVANPSEVIMKYIVDFFGINVYILRENLNADYILATDEGNECIYKPCVIIYKDDDCFYPVYSNDDKMIFTYSKDEIVKDLYEKFIPRKSLKAKKPKKDAEAEPETSEEPSVAAEQQHQQQQPIVAQQQQPAAAKSPSTNIETNTKNKRTATTKMSIEDLQTLAREYNIEITKKKGDKDVNKTKKDLYDEINEFAASS